MNLSRNLSLRFFSKKMIISLILIVSIFIIDRISKILIINHQLENNLIFINNFLNLDLVWNTGIGFGFFSTDSNFFYNSLSLFIFIVLLFLLYLIIKSDFFDKINLSIIFGGAISNFYDRIIYLAVPDFIDFHINNFHWFTFNIADIFITLGIILIILKDILKKKNVN